MWVLSAGLVAATGSSAQVRRRHAHHLVAYAPVGVKGAAFVRFVATSVQLVMHLSVSRGPPT